jgi:hypothetical protein
MHSTSVERSRLPLLALWLFATALNVTKPFHVDDAFYVAQARWIASHPGQPTSGLVFWEGDRPAPFHRVGNHAPLVPALQALAVTLTGEEPITLHLLTAFFTALVILLAHALALRHAPEHAQSVVVLVISSPALLAEQNVMLDVPLLACWLAFFAALDEPRPRGLLGAAAALALALLVKLSSVVLAAVLLQALVARARARTVSRPEALVAALLPVGALLGWALASLAETGEIAFLARSADVLAPTVERSLAATLAIGLGRGALAAIVLGAVAPAALVVVPASLFRSSSLGWLVGGVVATLLLLVIGRAVVLPIASAHGLVALAGEPLHHTALRAVDLVLGVGLVALALLRARRGDEIDRRLGAWLVLGLLACVGLTPFVAARHVLTVLLPLWLLVARGGGLGLAAPLSSRGLVATAAIVVTASLGLLAAVSDHRLASVYAANAPALAQLGRAHSETGQVYYLGHWGWQEHAERAGLEAYVPGHTRLRRGDVLLEPLGVDAPTVLAADRARLEPVAERVVEASFWDVVRTTLAREGLYVTWQGLPWTLSQAPLERFVIHRVR